MAVQILKINFWP